MISNHLFILNLFAYLLLPLMYFLQVFGEIPDHTLLRFYCH